MKVLEHAAEEFADDQRIHQRRPVFGIDRMPDGVQRGVAAIDLVREVHFISAAAIVIGAPRADGKPKRHGLQRSWFIAGHLEALNLRRDRDAVMTNGMCGSTAALGQ